MSEAGKGLHLVPAIVQSAARGTLFRRRGFSACPSVATSQQQRRATTLSNHISEELARVRIMNMHIVFC